MTGIHCICDRCVENIRYNGNYDLKILEYGYRTKLGRCEFCNKRDDYLRKVEIKKRGE